MNEVWIIVSISRQTCGHGDSADVVSVAQADAYSTCTALPAFTNKRAAEAYIAGLKYGYNLKPYCLKVQHEQI